jgi:hypothetical protein
MTGCLYFTAYISKSSIVRFVSLLRSIEDNCMFDRTFDKTNSYLEFFVPQKMENRFLEIMNIMKSENLVKSFNKKNIFESSIYV